ncbi:MAG: transporter substrate-binding domain-containing protein [Spirochaetaceae bacterium]|jgi:L-cystine transport system substrate-binding protein|nr:transporter substrate-binding domain-containing protein [Spirochaetaceae bacterium]
MKTKKVLKVGFFVLIALIGAFTAFSCAKKEQTVVIGTGQAYEPFCFRDADGNLTGYDVEVVREINKRLPEYKFEFEVFEFKNVLVSLATGKIDVGAHEFEENPERRKTYLYGEVGYNDYDSWIAVKEEGPWRGLRGIDDIAGNKNAVLAVSMGSNHEAFVKTWNETHDSSKQITYISFEDNYTRNQNIASERVAAQLSTLFDIDLINVQMPGLKLKAIGSKPVITSQAYFLFKKDNVKLQQDFDRVLLEMKEDGTLDKIKETVFKSYFESF